MKLPDAGIELDWSNWVAIMFPNRGNKILVSLELQNYKYVGGEKLLKLVFPCGFLYFSVFTEYL